MNGVNGVNTIATSTDAVRARAVRARTRGLIIGAVSSVLVFAGAALAIGSSSGWPQVRRLFFDPKLFWRSFVSAGSNKGILSSLWYTMQIFVVSEIIVLVVGMLIALTRLSKSPVLFPMRLLATVFVDVMRSVPAILLILLFGFGIPALGLDPPWNKAVLWGVLALSLMYAAYVSEVFRAGIESIHPSQLSAARSLGLSKAQAMRYVVVPQAVRRVIPPLLNDYIGLQKDTALIHTVGVIELVRRTQVLQAKYFNYTPYVSLMVVYLALTIPLTRLADRLMKREQARRR